MEKGRGLRRATEVGGSLLHPIDEAEGARVEPAEFDGPTRQRQDATLDEQFLPARRRREVERLRAEVAAGYAVDGSEGRVGHAM